MADNARRSESQRLLKIASNLLETKDLTGAKDFAVSAQDSDPLLDGSDQILAISDVLLAADKKVNNRPNWYAILQLESRSNDLDLLKKQYRKLALLLHPDKNKFPYSHDAFRLVSDAWAVVSDSSKKSLYDRELNVYVPVNLVSKNEQRSRNEVKKSREAKLQKDLVNFWTVCPYCYNLHQYPRVYIECCLKCSNCERAIYAVEIPNLPSVVKGKDGFNCFWGCFPMGYVSGNGKRGFGKGEFPNWMPPLFPNVANGSGGGGFRNLNVRKVGKDRNVKVSPVVYGNVTSVKKPGTGKRGRPRKNPDGMPPLFQNVANVNGGVEGGFQNLNVPEVGKDRNVKVNPVSDSAKADFRNLNVSQDEYVTPAPVYDYVTSVQKPGTKKRGRPRKNPY